MSFEHGWSYLLDPMNAEQFLAEHWEPQKPLYIPGDESKFADLLDKKSFLRAITGMPNDGKLQLRVGYSNADDTGSAYGFFGGEEALEHFANGATICVTALEGVEPRVRKFRDILAQQWPSPDPLIVNCYYSPEGQGFGTHYDPQSVWVMQLEGRKKWHYSTKRAMAFPNEGITAMELRQHGSPLLDSIETMVSVELKPGDVLYLPPGTWHRAEASGGESLALSVSQMNHGTRRLVSKALRTRMLDAERRRRHFPLPLPGSSDVDLHLRTLLSELKETVNALTVDDLRDQWAQMALPDGGEKPQAVMIAAEDRVRIPKPLAAFPNEPMGTLLVYRNQRRYELPMACRFIVDEVGGELAASDVAERLDATWEEASPLIEDLLQIGVLARA
jgi:ribosomal protein L16 Arg81 hydroxylase